MQWYLPRAELACVAIAEDGDEAAAKLKDDPKKRIRSPVAAKVNRKLERPESFKMKFSGQARSI